MIDRIAIPLRDHLRLSLLLDAMGADVTTMTVMCLSGNPPAKVRHRYRVIGTGKKRHVQTYADPVDAAAEKRTADFLRQALPMGPMTGNVALAALFYRASRQSIDTDNLLKHIGDAGNGIAWEDDSQITAAAGIIELDASEPRTIFAIAPHRSTMLRGTDAVGQCRACGEPCDLDRLFCSTACAGAGRRKGFVPFGTPVTS